MSTTLKNKISPLIFNFSQVYSHEPFCTGNQFRWLDCTHLHGTDCYCDPEAARALKQLIAPYPPGGIHFIDSGNYHYLTKFWTDKITRPFSLIVFDHHPDMQPTLFESMISCGSWVKDVIDENPCLRKVFVIGASESLIRAVPEKYRSRVCFNNAMEQVDEPVYISIDKDVLNPQSAMTNWDQGSLSLDELKNILVSILKENTIIGVDVCGECSASLDIFEEEREAEMDSRANWELLGLFREYNV